MDLSAFSYGKFVQFALKETQLWTTLTPRPIQENLESLRAKDGSATLHTLSCKAPKIRHLRSLSIEGSPAMQVLDFAAFPEPNFDFPIFCANFFTTSTLSVIVLDLNPLHDVTLQRDYKEKYYKSLMPLYQRYAELLPWGDKITSESLQFFSPIVIWSKLSSNLQNYEILYAAFQDYFKAWLVSMELAVEAADNFQAAYNCEAQHKYLTWRAEKDPGHSLLKRLIGENLANEIIRNFLFEGVGSLGTKTFLDYFPEYHCEDGSINQKRSMIGKAYKTRPWDAGGEFIGHYREEGKKEETTKSREKKVFICTNEGQGLLGVVDVQGCRRAQCFPSSSLAAAVKALHFRKVREFMARCLLFDALRG